MHFHKVLKIDWEISTAFPLFKLVLQIHRALYPTVLENMPTKNRSLFSVGSIFKILLAYKVGTSVRFKQKNPLNLECPALLRAWSVRLAFTVWWCHLVQAGISTFEDSLNGGKLEICHSFQKRYSWMAACSHVVVGIPSFFCKWPRNGANGHLWSKPENLDYGLFSLFLPHPRYGQVQKYCIWWFAVVATCWTCIHNLNLLM